MRAFERGYLPFTIVCILINISQRTVSNMLFFHLLFLSEKSFLVLKPTSPYRIKYAMHELGNHVKLVSTSLRFKSENPASGGRNQFFASYSFFPSMQWKV